MPAKHLPPAKTEGIGDKSQGGAAPVGAGKAPPRVPGSPLPGGPPVHHKKGALPPELLRERKNPNKKRVSRAKRFLKPGAGPKLPRSEDLMAPTETDLHLHPDHPMADRLEPPDRVPADPNPVMTRWGAAKTRKEIRTDAAAAFHNLVVPVLGMSVERAMARMRKDKELELSNQQLSALTNIGQLFSQVGVGAIGANQVDPADVAKLPPLVINTVAPTTELPDGKPD